MFKTIEEGSASTWLQGRIDVEYAKLVKVFGEPISKVDEYKSDAEWHILFEDGILATIYNYKDGKNYLGDKGMLVKDITEWHIGGKTHKSVINVLYQLERK